MLIFGGMGFRYGLGRGECEREGWGGEGGVYDNYIMMNILYYSNMCMNIYRVYMCLYANNNKKIVLINS